MHCGPIKVLRHAIAAAICSVILIFAACSTAHSQTQLARDGKFDEFGNVKTDDAMAHLDLFAGQLNSNPNLQGFVIGHNRSDGLNGSLLRLAYGYLDYLVNSRGVLESRVKVLEGEARKEIGFELWLLPVGAASPIPTPAPQTEPGAPKQFDEVWLGNESECVGELTIELYKLEDALRFFGEALRRQSSAKAWIVVHPSTRETTTRAARTVVNSKGFLRMKSGIDSNRILTALSGRRLSKCTVLNLWIVPSNSLKADESAYHSQLMDEAEKNNYTVRRVELVGNQRVRDSTLRKRFLPQEGDVFTRRALEKSLKNFSRLKMIYPVSLNDVEVRLDRDEKLMDFTVYFRERPGRTSKTH